MKTITKEFEGSSWYSCIHNMIDFLFEYNLDCINLEVKKGKTKYVGILTYGLGLERDD